MLQSETESLTISTAFSGSPIVKQRLVLFVLGKTEHTYALDSQVLACSWPHVVACSPVGRGVWHCIVVRVVLRAGNCACDRDRNIGPADRARRRGGFRRAVRMKRGLLYSCCREHGYNKLVLAQHLDDLAESFIMSALHNGQVRNDSPAPSLLPSLTPSYIPKTFGATPRSS